MTPHVAAGSLASVSDERYARQIVLPEIGADGQARLAGAHAVVVGCGALGSLQAELLTRAGVGRVTVVDRDFVERSNLQRQSLFTDEDAAAGRPKATAAQRALEAINPDVRIEAVVDDLRAENADALLSDADVVGDGTDNFETRYLINDWCVREGVPWVYAGVIGTGGLVHPILPGDTPCLLCVFETPPVAGSLPTCETAGVLGPAVAVIAGIQTAETLKLLLGARERVLRGIVRYDAWEASFTTLDAGRPRPDCPACAEHRYDWLEGRRGHRAARLCGRNAIQLLPRGAAPPPLETVAHRLGSEWEVLALNPVLLRARRAGLTLNLFRDGRAIVDGTSDEAEARSVYARAVGT